KIELAQDRFKVSIRIPIPEGTARPGRREVKAGDGIVRVRREEPGGSIYMVYVLDVGGIHHGNEREVSRQLVATPRPSSRTRSSLACRALSPC
nr:hypothetical protein [Candidatus Sigynarchaeota archaeon]